jgi:hypothetical protein
MAGQLARYLEIFLSKWVPNHEIKTDWSLDRMPGWSLAVLRRFSRVEFSREAAAPVVLPERAFFSTLGVFQRFAAGLDL